MSAPPYISPHFSYGEVTTTDHEHLRDSNHPSPEELLRARLLAWSVLEPLRTRVGALRVNSWFRSPGVNAAVGGSPTSDHLDGSAADVRPAEVTVDTAWRRLLGLVDLLPIDQAILYPASIWGQGHDRIHLGMRSRPGEEPRRQLLVCVGTRRYVPWSDFAKR